MVEKTVENGDIFYLTFSSIKNIVLALFSTNSETSDSQTISLHLLSQPNSRYLHQLNNRKIQEYKVMLFILV